MSSASATPPTLKSRWLKSLQRIPASNASNQRALCALEISHPEKLISSLTPSTNPSGLIAMRPSANPTVLAVLQKCLGEELTKDVLSRMGTPETKKRLSENTDRALNSGAFGIRGLSARMQREEGRVLGIRPYGLGHSGSGSRGQLELEKGAQGPCCRRNWSSNGCVRGGRVTCRASFGELALISR